MPRRISSGLMICFVGLSSPSSDPSAVYHALSLTLLTYAHDITFSRLLNTSITGRGAPYLPPALRSRSSRYQAGNAGIACLFVVDSPTSLRTQLSRTASCECYIANCAEGGQISYMRYGCCNVVVDLYLIPGTRYWYTFTSGVKKHTATPHGPRKFQQFMPYHMHAHQAVAQRKQQTDHAPSYDIIWCTPRNRIPYRSYTWGALIPTQHHIEHPVRQVFC